MASASEDYKKLEIPYGDDMLVLVVAAGFLERLLDDNGDDALIAELAQTNPRFPEAVCGCVFIEGAFQYLVSHDRVRGAGGPPVELPIFVVAESEDAGVALRVELGLR